MDNIFDGLWIEKYRPQKLTDLVLTEENRKFFEQFRGKTEIPHLLFSGSPGIGKTTIAQILVDEILNCQYLYINASEESGVDTIRSKVMTFAQTLSLDGRLKVVILDEIDGLSGQSGAGRTSGQQALRNVIEKYSTNTRFIATCNYISNVSAPLKSRFQMIDLTPPWDGVVERIEFIVKSEKIRIPEENKLFFAKLIKNSYPDMRKMIGELQKYTIGGVFCGNNSKIGQNISTELLGMIKSKENAVKIREFVIKNEIEFGNDYHSLLKMLFETVYNDKKIKDDTKAIWMVTISEHMYQHQFVMDKEINFTACYLNMLAKG